MSENQVTGFLTIILVILVPILIVLLAVWISLWIKGKKREKNPYQSEPQIQEKEIIKKADYNKQSIFNFMEFDEISDNMIIRKNGNKYIMVIECQGINYDLMSGLEKNSVEQGFLQFLNTLRYPIQLYIQTRTVNLSGSLNTYKQKVDEIGDEYIKKKNEYSRLSNLEGDNEAKVNNSKLEYIKAQNLYEYGLDIIQNTERMNLNKNILKKHYFVILSYSPEENSKAQYNKEEIASLAFSDLYTRGLSIISSLSVCNIKSKVLNSEELAELLYITYNRDESELLDLKKAINAGFQEIYSTAKDAIDKRMEELDKEIEIKSTERANEAAFEVISSREKQRKLKEKENEMEQIIDMMAKSLLEENEEILGKEIVKEAKEVIDKKPKKGAKKNV